LVSTGRSRRSWLDLAVLSALLLAAGSPLLAGRIELDLPASLQSLPGRVADWEIDRLGGPMQLPDVDEEFIPAYPGTHPVRRFIGADEQLVRTYRNQSGSRVQLYVGYYQRQEEGHEITADVGSALHSVASPVTISLPSGEAVLNEVARNTRGMRRGLLFWYDVNGRIVRNLYLAKGLTIWDTLTRRRANGAVVIIRWEDAGQGDAARTAAIEFAKVLVPALRQHLPSDRQLSDALPVTARVAGR